MSLLDEIRARWDRARCLVGVALDTYAHPESYKLPVPWPWPLDLQPWALVDQGKRIRALVFLQVAEHKSPGLNYACNPYLRARELVDEVWVYEVLRDIQPDVELTLEHIAMPWFQCNCEACR